jgi:hypothetical protein
MTYLLFSNLLFCFKVVFSFIIAAVLAIRLGSSRDTSPPCNHNAGHSPARPRGKLRR